MNVFAALVDFIQKTGIRLSFALPASSSGFTNPSSMGDLSIIRREFTDKSTIGEFMIDGDLFCYTLERSCRTIGEEPLAIPAGRYELEIYHSPHFGFDVLLLKDVPGRSFIEIHPANRPEELQGCVAPGMRKGLDIVYDSRNAFEKIMAEVRKRLQLGKVFITISGGRIANS